MKTILVATDFSSTASNAADYAAEMANKTHAELLLLHVYQVPLEPVEGGAIMLPVNDLEKMSDQRLQEEAARIRRVHKGAVRVKYKSVCGFAADEIAAHVKANPVDLIVMGIQGAGFLKEKMIGSVTTTVINRAVCPVMVIDQSVKFRMIKKIIFACNSFKYEDKSALRPLNEIIRRFGSHLYVLNVVDIDVKVPSSPDELSDYDLLEESLGNTDRSFHYWPHNDLAEGINEFVTEKEADLVALLPRHHSFISRMFREPLSKEMAFHSKVPLLILTNDAANRVNMIL